jgi:hypothetical protein
MFTLSRPAPEAYAGYFETIVPDEVLGDVNVIGLGPRNLPKLECGVDRSNDEGSPINP